MLGTPRGDPTGGSRSGSQLPKERSTTAKEKPSDELPGGPVALVLTGDGARSAYEAGALSVLLPLLRDEDTPRIILGTSAGALNAALIAAVIDQGLDVAAKRLPEAWRTIRPEKVFTRPLSGTVSFIGWHLRHASRTAPGLLDTRPLQQTIADMLQPHDFGHGVESGELESLGVAASSCSTSEAVVFVEGKVPPPSGERIRYLPTKLTIPHLLASSAFPLAFPAQWVDDPSGGDWYIDGGIHLNAPLKPAIDLGANRLLVLGATQQAPALRPDPDDPPNFGDGGGQILHAVLTDRLQADLAQLRRTNASVRKRGGPSGSDDDHRLIATCLVTPPDDRLSQVAAEIWPSGWWSLLSSFGGYRFLGGMTVQRQQPGQYLSYLCFHPEFIDQAIAMGQADAEAALGGATSIPWECP
jgi:NTE family protein